LRKQLLELLLCPVCEKRNFTLLTEEVNSVEVRSGKVVCNNCKSEFSIKDGILNLLVNTRKEVLLEQKGWIDLDKKLGTYEREITEELALKLPDIDRVIDPVFREDWRPHIVNFNKALEILNLKGDEKILDIGAGRCWTTKSFTILGCQSVAFDILDDAVLGLGCADKVLSEHFYFDRALGDMEKLPFSDERFDVVFSTASIHHSDILKSIPECSRVLKSGGRFVLINEPTATAAKRFMSLELEEAKAGIAEHIYLLSEYCSAVADSGVNVKLYCSPGSLLAIKRNLRDLSSEKGVGAKNSFALMLLKTKLLNSKTLRVIWEFNKSSPSFGLFMIGTKS
jgi:uncharacterized protein YbaR (Trm112 family)